MTETTNMKSVERPTTIKFTTTVKFTPEQWAECEECGFPVDPNNTVYPAGSECICDLKVDIDHEEVTFK